MIAPSLHVEGAKKRFFYWVEVSTLGVQGCKASSAGRKGKHA
jgi:hypothetical protein